MPGEIDGQLIDGAGDAIGAIGIAGQLAVQGNATAHHVQVIVQLAVRFEQSDATTVVQSVCSVDERTADAISAGFAAPVSCPVDPPRLTLATIAKGGVSMATTMDVSLSEPLKDFVDEQVKRGGYSSTSDYVRQLIREHRARVSADEIRQRIAQGVAAEVRPATDRPKSWADFFAKAPPVSEAFLAERIDPPPQDRALF
jgi:putative addiction module CopG family antidote